MRASDILGGIKVTASDIIEAADQTGHVFHGNQWVKTEGLPWQGADTKWKAGGSYPENAKLKAFAEKVHQDTHQRYLDEFGNPDLHQHYVKVKQGNKFDKVDVGGSGAFMVEKETGQIYGVKAYGVVHPGKRYGTLDTIHEYNWGNHYYPVHQNAPKPRVVYPVNQKPASVSPTTYHADGSVSLAASNSLTAADVLKAGAPVGNRNAAGPHSKKAKMYSSYAEKETHAANMLGTHEAHTSASLIHKGAAEAHREAYAKEEGDDNFHLDKAQEHEQAASFHAGKAAEAAEKHFARTSDATSSDAVRARSASDVIYAGATAQFPVQASSKPWATGEPVEFMYMPGGTHTICAGFRSASIKLTVQVDPEDAARVLNGSLEQLRASQPKQLPFGCVEHEEKDASVWAKGFSAKADGVYLCAEPSELGARHVNGRIHRSWSPSFLTDADYAKALLVDGTYEFPDGVRGSESNPARITGCAFCLGTLTNKPAFREMSPVKAREAVRAGAPMGNQNAAGPHKHLGEFHREGRRVFYSTGTHVFSADADNVSDPATGYTIGRLESTVDHWNRYQKALGHPEAPSSKPTGAHKLTVQRAITPTETRTFSVIAPSKSQAEEWAQLHHEGGASTIIEPHVTASDPQKPTGPAPFDAGALLDVARSLRVAHWNADTSTNEHEALGELYDSWEDGMDQLVEALCGKRGCEVKDDGYYDARNECVHKALAALEQVKSGLDCEADADLCNIVADMENAVNKGRYLLKAKETQDMTASEILKASGTSEGVKKSWETRKGYRLQAVYSYGGLDNPTPNRDAHPEHIEKMEWEHPEQAHDYAKSLMPLHERIHSVRVVEGGKIISQVDNPSRSHRWEATSQKVKATDTTPSSAVRACDILNRQSAPSGATAQPGGR